MCSIDVYCIFVGLFIFRVGIKYVCVSNIVSSFLFSAFYSEIRVNSKKVLIDLVTFKNF